MTGKGSNVITLNSWSDIIDQLYVDSWEESIKRFRSNYAFRGVPNKDYTMETSLKRLVKPKWELEYHMMRNFRKYARVEGTGDYSIWNWLVMAQHHGLPTRLLDWTFSPFVAMHFATSDLNQYDHEGAIWMVDFVKLHERIPDLLRDELEREGANGFTVEMLSSVSPSLKEFDNLSRENFAIFFDPPSMNDRIVNQYAMHSVISHPGVDMEEILDRNPDLWRKIIISKDIKWEIRDKLDQANINERMLFPGLDGLSKWLARHYTPRR